MYWLDVIYEDIIYQICLLLKQFSMLAYMQQGISTAVTDVIVTPAVSATAELLNISKFTSQLLGEAVWNTQNVDKPFVDWDSAPAPAGKAYSAPNTLSWWGGAHWTRGLLPNYPTLCSRPFNLRPFGLFYLIPIHLWNPQFHFLNHKTFHLFSNTVHIFGNRWMEIENVISPPV